MAKGERLDAVVVARGLFASRTEAQSAIMQGAVLVNGEKLTKPGAPVKADAQIELIGSFARKPYVSRGGLKLERALREFDISARDRICLDVGASTGGFTDCLLKHGARKVFAIDVGYGQLDWRLRQDPRVQVIERMNARDLTADALYSEDEERADLAAVDVSFISLSKVIPRVVACLKEKTSDLICLVKPQFEAGREKVGKGGVIKSADIHIEVLQHVLTFALSVGIYPEHLTYSPIKGPKGNIEFLAHFSLHQSQNQIDVAPVVRQAHENLS
ncbi:MAG TPA: TlyA family RNA methyltransferase [Candidatus Obscuribacterales bacterium]